MRRQVILRQWNDDEADLDMPTLQHSYEVEQEQFDAAVALVRSKGWPGVSHRFIAVDTHMIDRLDTTQRLALSVALAQISRDEPISPNVAVKCALTLAQLVGHPVRRPEQEDQES